MFPLVHLLLFATSRSLALLKPPSFISLQLNSSWSSVVRFMTLLTFHFSSQTPSTTVLSHHSSLSLPPRVLPMSSASIIHHSTPQTFPLPPPFLSLDLHFTIITFSPSALCSSLLNSVQNFMGKFFFPFLLFQFSLYLTFCFILHGPSDRLKFLLSICSFHNLILPPRKPQSSLQN